MLSSKLMSASSGGPLFIEQSSVVQAAGTTLTLNIPTSKKSGDLLLAFLGKQDNDVYGIPAGWTKLAEFAVAGGGGSNGNGAPVIVSKISDGTETTAAFTNPKGGCVGVIYVYRGSTAGTAGAYADPTGTGTSNPVAPSITMTSAGILLCIAATVNATTYTAPSGMTLKTNSASTIPSLVIYEQIITAAGATGTRTVGTSVNANALLFPIY